MAPDDNPPTEREPCPLERGDAEFAKALDMPETGARYQQLDRASVLFAEADAAKLHHPLLVPYDDLPEREKEKDRDTVRNIPKLLAKAKCLVKAL
jgi:hypothetical protein